MIRGHRVSLSRTLEKVVVFLEHNVTPKQGCQFGTLTVSFLRPKKLLVHMSLN